MLRPREAAGGRIQGSRAGTDGSHAPPVVGIGFPAWGRGVLGGAGQWWGMGRILNFKGHLLSGNGKSTVNSWSVASDGR